MDLHEKAHKAIYTHGPCFLNVLAPCPRGWRYETPEIAEICRLAVETCVWPLYEIVEGVWKLSYEPKKKLPVEEFLKKQGRFAHMFKKGNDWMIDEAQEYVDKQWDKLLAKCGIEYEGCGTKQLARSLFLAAPSVVRRRYEQPLPARFYDIFAGQNHSPTRSASMGAVGAVGKLIPGTRSDPINVDFAERC